MWTTRAEILKITPEVTFGYNLSQVIDLFHEKDKARDQLKAAKPNPQWKAIKDLTG